jgi:hypothetical protein
MVSTKELVGLEQNIDKCEKDFNYLKKPSQVPQAYEHALNEVRRRRKFRQVLD